MDHFKHNYKLLIAYDGTNYCGWQIQPNGPTIQEILQKSINTLLRSQVQLIGSGRTDAGVHALGQTAHFKCNHSIDLYRFHGSLNALLPRDIRVIEIVPVPLQFHAQYSALRKTYHYHLHLDRVLNPFKRLYSLHVLEKIDTHRLREAAKQFLGTHDFTSFANEAHTGTAAHDAIRTIHRLDVIPQEGGVRLEFEADGFLYKMVRNIVGTLLEVAAFKCDIEEIASIFEAKDRRRAGKAALPHGLFLMHVEYSSEISHLH